MQYATLNMITLAPRETDNTSPAEHTIWLAGFKKAKKALEILEKLITVIQTITWAVITLSGLSGLKKT